MRKRSNIPLFIMRETTLPIKWIAARLQMGTPKSSRCMLKAVAMAETLGG